MARRPIKVGPRRITRRKPSIGAMISSRSKDHKNVWVPVFQAAAEADGHWICVELNYPDVEAARLIAGRVNRGAFKMIHRGEFGAIYDSANVWVRLKHGANDGGYDELHGTWANTTIDTIGNLVVDYDSSLENK